MGRKIIIVLCLLLAAGQAWGATYYKRSNGSAANKEAATGPCTTPENCMSSTIYSGEIFENGDIIVHCHTLQGIPGKIWSEGFLDISQTLSLVPNNALKDSDGKYFKVEGAYFIVQGE